MKTHSCRDCQADFTASGPGRPPLRCPECREKIKEREERATESINPSISGIELVDRLELHLKAAGLHISQHRKEWE